MPQKRPENLSLAESAGIATHITECLGIAIGGQIAYTFRRGTSYAKVKKFADKLGGEVYTVRCRVTYEILPENKYYDTSPKVSY